MLLAAITAEGWVLVVGAVGAVIIKIMEKWYDQRQLKNAAATVANKVEEVKTETAAKAEEVKTALVVSNAKKEAHLVKQDRAIEAVAVQIDRVGETVDHVKSQTNGMMAKIEDASFAKGVKSETDKNGS